MGMMNSGAKKPEITYKSYSYDVVSAQLAQAVVRLMNRQKGLAERTEQSVSTGVLTTQEDLHDAQ